MTRAKQGAIPLGQITRLWEEHAPGRALGGRRALSGFRYQLALSLEQFLEAVRSGGGRDSTHHVVFDCLSDLAQTEGELVYLTQAKVNLDADALRKATSEALAVDAFIEQQCPELRMKFRFRISTRRAARELPLEPQKLGAEYLRLDGDDARRWESLRERCLPIVVEGDPRLRLAISLWNDVRLPFAFIDQCLGRLGDALGENIESDKIAEQILGCWEDARKQDKPRFEGKWLGPNDFQPQAARPSRRIFHDSDPTLNELQKGCFVVLEKRLRRVTQAIEQHLHRAMDAEEPPASSRSGTELSHPGNIRVFWIEGVSGIGKSVLLLQAIEHLVVTGVLDAVGWVRNAGELLDAYWDSHDHSHIIFAGDDLHATRNRNQQAWEQLARIAQNARTRLPAIVTCGSPEDARALRSQLPRDSGVVVTSIAIQELQAEEQHTYHAWYQDRTQEEVPEFEEPSFILAAWRYELFREQRLGLKEFAKRLDARLEELGLRAPARAAMALNAYGLDAPENLFQGNGAALEVLREERIWHLRSGSLSRSGRFYHPKIAEDLWLHGAQLDPSREGPLRVARAEDVAFGVRAMLMEPLLCEVFFRWLDCGKIGRRRPKHVTALDSRTREEISSALWRCCFSACDPRRDIASLYRWHTLAWNANVLPKVGAHSTVWRWWSDSEPSARHWSLLFEMACREANKTEQTRLAQAGRHWLEQHRDSAAWPHVFCRVWDLSDKAAELRGAGLAWLSQRATHQFWPRVWGKLFDTAQLESGSAAQQMELLDLGLAALPGLPESDADLSIWQKMLSASPKPLEFVRPILMRVNQSPSRHKVSCGLDLLLRFAPRTEVIAALAQVNAKEGDAWPHIWLRLSEQTIIEEELLLTGIEWLRGREHQPEWSFVWQRLIDSKYERAKLLQIGLDWLDARALHPAWSYVWISLLDESFSVSQLLAQSLTWLKAQEDHPRWVLIWRRVRQRSKSDTLSELGLQWLGDRSHEALGGWPSLWKQLFDDRFRRGRLRELATAWLAANGSTHGADIVQSVLADRPRQRARRRA